MKKHHPKSSEKLNLGNVDGATTSRDERHEPSIDSEVMPQILQSPHHSEGENGPLSNEEVSSIILQNSAVKRCKARIEHWCKNVFGNSDILRESVEGILTDPSMGGELVERLSNNCRSFGKLSGVNICGIKNRVRRRAEASISPLIDTVEEFTAVVQQVKEGISQNHQAQRECRESSLELAESLHTQQGLSKSSESLSASTHREGSETSRHRDERAQSVESCKALKIKALGSIG
ncbi:BID domain-containing T4SS effector [Bartonella sp. B39]